MSMPTLQIEESQSIDVSTDDDYCIKVIDKHVLGDILKYPNLSIKRTTLDCLSPDPKFGVKIRSLFIMMFV